MQNKISVLYGKDQSAANDFGFDQGFSGEFFAFSNAIGTQKCVYEQTTSLPCHVDKKVGCRSRPRSQNQQFSLPIRTLSIHPPFSSRLLCSQCGSTDISATAPAPTAPLAFPARSYDKDEISE
jgi:hypothetical protein